MTTLAVRSLSKAEDSRDFPHGHIDVVKLGVEFGRATFEPGWRWSQDIGPIAGTKSCQFHHYGFVQQGRFHIRMDDGTEADLAAGDMFECDAGHDAWVVGDETAIVYDFAGNIGKYAMPK
ncbi:cupin domain-containing protein [Yinghuangia seranimata]|uniref:cupin domain-containing protein n=1 Tax=Yinghuangia seranimata TaxID=408067 RepID=UPI00248D163D|nr:cupin domain-containing protein [Yinghuangia seranimata]MDI2125761.1 cupin domain-containing protein [Yinghuangia seranimata]